MDSISNETIEIKRNDFLLELFLTCQEVIETKFKDDVDNHDEIFKTILDVVNRNERMHKTFFALCNYMEHFENKDSSDLLKGIMIDAIAEVKNNNSEADAEAIASHRSSIAGGKGGTLMSHKQGDYEISLDFLNNTDLPDEEKIQYRIGMTGDGQTMDIHSYSLEHAMNIYKAIRNAVAGNMIYLIDAE
jgi:hypothetical protein